VVGERQAQRRIFFCRKKKKKREKRKKKTWFVLSSLIKRFLRWILGEKRGEEALHPSGGPQGDFFSASKKTKLNKTLRAAGTSL